MLVNLMSNAIKYNKEHGKVTFYCEPIREALKLGFADYLTKPIDVPVFIEKLKNFLL